MTDASTKNLENAVAEALTINVKEPVQFKQNGITDMDKLMATGARLLKQKLDEHISLVSSYELQRLELADSYRVRIERLRIEAEDQLRNLEQIHSDKLKSVEDLIAKLKTLRGGREMRGIIKYASRPRTFTSAERMIEAVRERVLTDGRTYKDIAKATGVANSTISCLAMGKTKWPRPTTLFPLLASLRMHIELVDD